MFLHLFMKLKKEATMNRNKIFRYLINQSYKNLTFVAVAVAVIFALCVNPAIAEITPNLLVNPGAEQDNTGWTFRDGFTTIYFPIDVPFIHSGDRSFFGGDDTSDSSAYQSVDVSMYVEAIDRGDVKASFTGWIVTPYDDDEGKLTLIFCDASGLSINMPHLWPTTGWQRCNPWFHHGIRNEPVPTGTRSIAVQMDSNRNSGSDNDAYFDDLSLTLALPTLKMITTEREFNFGNLYIETNATATAYNEARKKQLSFKNEGHSKLHWELRAGLWDCEIGFSETQGTLDPGQTQNVDVWLKITDDDSDVRHGSITLDTDGGDAPVIYFLAMTYPPAQIDFTSPPLHELNNKANVALNARVPFEVSEASPDNPDAEVTGYRWQKVASGGDLGEFEQSSASAPEYNFTFDNPGDWTVYCKSVEEANGLEVESDLVEVPVRAWNRPTVNETPPPSEIAASTVSWYGGKYIGVVWEPVRLMADGSTDNTGSDNPPEAIAKYLWDFDNNWDTIELEQLAGQAASYTWNSPNLNGQIRCKAETNYGVRSDEKLFNLTIYDKVEPNAAGPYTGRPNTAVTFQGSAEKTKYPGAAFQYQWRVDSITPAGTLKGDATSAEDYIQLTPDEPDKSGQFEYADLLLSDDWNVTGEFWSGGGGDANAFYIYVWANGTPDTEDSANGQYSINFDEYEDQIQLNYNNIRLADVPQTDIDNSEWRRFAVVFNQGIFLVYLDGRLRLEYDDGANYPTRMSNNLFGFGARTGGFWNYHRVRNMKWTTGTPVSTDSNGKAEHTWAATGNESDTYGVQFTTTVTTEDEFVLIGSESTTAIIEAGKPTALPGGPYRGGIAGGNFSPIQFEGNHPDYVEAEDVGNIVDWVWTFGDEETSSGKWNPTHAYASAGKYTISLKVQSQYGKWSELKAAEVEVLDGIVAGYVRAADLRTPVREVTLTLTSSHVDTDVLASIAGSDDKLNTTGDGGIRTLTDANGYYEFAHIPLGSYRIRANKGEGDNAHEFQTAIQATELTLDGPNQLAIDFVDISVYPVGGRIVYSIQKNGQDVLVDGAKVKAYPIGSTSFVEALLSTKSLSATGTNYSMPLFAGKYLFVPELSQHDVRIKEDTPGYDLDTQLVTIEDARTDIDFVDYTARELTVFVEDSGGYRITAYPDTGNPIKVTVSGNNGQVSDQEVDAEGKIVVDMNPGEYTVTVTGASPETEDVDLTGGDQAITMTIPVQIELSISPKPKLFDVPDEFLAQFGMAPEDNPEGYMYYYPPEPRSHTYTITATANGKPVEDFTLFVTDDVSMMTVDAAVEQEMFVSGDEGEYTIIAGLPKKTDDELPLAEPKIIRFRATKDGYLDSDPVEDDVTVLGDVAVGTAAKIVSVPVVNYTVLHDPPGDGSYSYLNDSMTMKGLVTGLQIQIEDEEIPVYPSPWRNERKVKDFEFEKSPDSSSEFKDMKDKGLLGYKNSDPTLGHFTWAAALEATTGAAIVVSGPAGYVFQLAKLGIKAAAVTPVGTSEGIVQYEVSPNRHIETPSGDKLPDILGPGKGDIYFGEGWTLGLQTKHRLGIQWNEDTEQWDLTTAQIETYDILDRTNQYVYTIRDIENIINDLTNTIDTLGDGDEKTKLTSAKNTWQQLLNNNLAYLWNQNYLMQGKTFEDFKSEKGGSLDDDDTETLIFSAGPTFEYSRTISTVHTVSFSTGFSLGSSSEMGHGLAVKMGTVIFGSGIQTEMKFGSSASIGSSTSFGASWESGQAAEQNVGFVLQDDDVGDNISTRVYADPRWGTPIFFQDAGSYTSDPWEPGTNKAVDVTLELLEQPTGTFDYHDGAHYTIKVTYTGSRDLESPFQTVDFNLYAPKTDNEDSLVARFNGGLGPRGLGLTKEAPSALIAFSLYPPKKDQSNSEEKQYEVDIVAQEVADLQITRILHLSPTFADLQPPRAVITAPYDGERISPVFFPEDDPFEIEVVSENTDLASIQLQIRSKQPDGVWEPWRNLSGMLWEDGGANDNVTVFDRLDRKPPRREFTFQWAEDAISTLGVGEYALRAIATDQATRSSQPAFPGNVDLDAPFVVFLVDDAKPSVLNSIPDYQARESERIYRGELSVTFTDDMRAMDFDDRTFYVMDLLDNNKKVAGYVSYSPALRKTVFVPIVPFQPNGFYRVEIKTDGDTDGDGTIDERGVHDLAGNPLDNSFMWTFRTTDAPFEPTWSMNFSVADGTSTDANNYATVEYGALDEEDEKDALAVPALASQLRMVFLNRDKVEFDRDIRPADGRLSHHWFFVIDNAPSGATVTINWTPSIKLTKTTRQYQVIRLVEFDGEGNVQNTIALDPTEASVNPDTGLIDPVEAYTYTNQGERSRYFRLDVQKVGFVAGTFEVGTSGWRFFSVPITPQRAEPFVNLGDDIDPFKLFQYDTGLSGYKIYPFDIGEVGLQTGHGYFTRLQENVDVDVGGSSNQDNVTLDLEAGGWHPIGNPFIKEVDVASLIVNDGSGEKSFDAAVAAGLVEGTLYRWNIVTDNAAFLSDIAISDSYEAVTSSDQLDPWDACWLKTNQVDLAVKIPAPADLPNNPPMPDYLKPPMAPSSVVDLAIHDERVLDKGEFDFCLELSSEFASDLSTMLGTRQNAKVDWDTFDQSEPPTLSKTVAVYFNHPNWGDDTALKNGAGGLYNRDYQPALKVGEQRTWKFTVYTDNQDAEMALSWEKAIAQVPGDLMLHFRRGDGQSDWQDMREVQSVELISRSRITEIPFEVRAERFEMSPLLDLQVVAGENQVLLRWKADDNEFISDYTITRYIGQTGSMPYLRYTLEPGVNQFIDTDVEEEATYTYQVTVHFLSGAELKSELFTVTVLPVIKKTALLQSYPNPFNPDVWIPYELENQDSVVIEIYNAAGQLVRTLDLGTQPRGQYISKSKAAHWDGRTFFGERAASGVYFYVLKTGKFAATRKMVILK